jgi:hypothetical protein
MITPPDSHPLFQDHNDAMCTKCGSYSIRPFTFLGLSRCLDCDHTDKDYRFTER